MPLRSIVDWLDVLLPNWFAFASGLLLALFGLIALGLLVLGLAPASLRIWLPLFAFFAAVNGGYTLWRRRVRGGTELTALSLALGLILGGVAYWMQLLVDQRLFASATPVPYLFLFLGASLAGLGIGIPLRLKYEKSRS
ncbi:MAG: hypothetical protein K9K39_01780 [Desulfohalobiaceae bacterium]|nr:hypothetical protein [Desulfohalobiaceae bacterium]